VFRKFIEEDILNLGVSDVFENLFDFSLLVNF